EAEVIADVARAINAALDINAILPLVADAARSLTGSDTASVALREPGGEAMVFRYNAGQLDTGYADARLAPTTGISGRVIGTARPARSDDVRTDPTIDDASRRLLDSERIVSLLVAPIAFGGRVEGLLYVAHRRPMPCRAQAQLVEDLLDVSRIVTGKLRLDVRAADLRDVITAAIDSVRTAADGKGVALEAHLPDTATTVTVDPDRLQQVVWNLLSNAIK